MGYICYAVYIISGSIVFIIHVLRRDRMLKQRRRNILLVDGTNIKDVGVGLLCGWLGGSDGIEII